MEQAMLWITVFGIIVIPLIGWLINTLITKKIDNLELSRKEDKDLFFNRLDSVKDLLNTQYVRKDLYQQALEYHQKEVDGKFNSLVESINKMDKDVKEKFDEVKDLINEKFNGQKQGGNHGN